MSLFDLFIFYWFITGLFGIGVSYCWAQSENESLSTFIMTIFLSFIFSWILLPISLGDLYARWQE